MHRYTEDDRNDGMTEAPWERAFNRVVTPFEEFIHNQTSSGILLMAAALLALIVANSPLVHAYERLIGTTLVIGFGPWTLEKTLHHWVNDGLMALFFFLAGLEIKREILAGELASPRKAALPIIAAAGGMLVPALIYLAVTQDGAAARGWGIPMATDIAFAVGALALLGNRIPASLIMFLVALAIVDDLGAVLVIALFYTEQVHSAPLIAAALLTGVLITLNLGGFRRPLPYFIVGALVWFAMLKSGIHATVAGVLVAFTIPAQAKFDPRRFSSHMRKLLDRFDSHYQPGAGILRNERQRAVVQTLENGIHNVETPLQRLEHSFHVPVGLLVIPVFALVNAGIPIAFGNLDHVLTHPVTVAVALGLVAGKSVGISGSTWLAVRLGIADLPVGVNFRQIVGVALLGGIGFTMSIFIAELGFVRHPAELLMAKSGILMASVVAGVSGLMVLLSASVRRP